MIPATSRSSVDLPEPLRPIEPDGLARLDVRRDVVERPDLLRPGAAARDQELLQRLRLAGTHDETPRNARRRRSHRLSLESFAIVTNVSW